MAVYVVNININLTLDSVGVYALGTGRWLLSVNVAERFDFDSELFPAWHWSVQMISPACYSSSCQVCWPGQVR